MMRHSNSSLRKPQPEESSAHSIGSVATSATQSLPPYPEKWIREVRRKNRHNSCLHLVYKQGCQVTRTGRIEVEITLDFAGSVTAIKPLKNTIVTDSKLVMRCVHERVTKWKFRPPKDVSPTFRMTFVFADKC